MLARALQVIIPSQHDQVMNFHVAAGGDNPRFAKIIAALKHRGLDAANEVLKHNRDGIHTNQIN